jgi:hypothetical protein
LLRGATANVAAALLMWRHWCYGFVFFLNFNSIASAASRKEMRVRKGKRSEIWNLFPGSIGWHNTSSFL